MLQVQYRTPFILLIIIYLYHFYQSTILRRYLWLKSKYFCVLYTTLSVSLIDENTAAFWICLSLLACWRRSAWCARISHLEILHTAVESPPPPPTWGWILFFNPLSFSYSLLFSPCISPTHFPWQSSWRNSINCAICDSKCLIHWLAPLCIDKVVVGSCNEAIVRLNNF